MKCFSITYLLDAQKAQTVEQKHNLSKQEGRNSEVGNTAFTPHHDPTDLSFVTQAHDSTKLFIPNLIITILPD